MNTGDPITELFCPPGAATTFLGNDIFSVSDKSASHVVTVELTVSSDDVAVIVVGT